MTMASTPAWRRMAAGRAGGGGLGGGVGGGVGAGVLGGGTGTGKPFFLTSLMALSSSLMKASSI